MSNLISKYEISVWDDVLKNGEYIEEKVCVIGSDIMSYQGKVIEPQFIRRANGEKKLIFKLYKTFVDNITGEKVQNVFYNYLINERKVKLYYEDKWYDFVIKNIVENSSNYLYTYQLEDALVQELSKNGFDKAFDVELQNNLGTAKELAERALEGTDWTVESDIFTEMVEENLIYLLVSEDIKANRIYSDINGSIIDIKEETIPKNSIILAFYSCCKNKPHRFQFIYLNEQYGEYNRELVPIDENRIITVPNCQYYIDINLNEEYVSNEEGYYLPRQFSIIKRSSSALEDNVDTTISNWYKGKRFGFAQKTEYVPLLETYANLFYKNEEVEGEVKQELYYGYPNTEFNSPVFTENIITNSDFKGATGWTGSYAGGTRNAKPTYGAEIESVYGEFNNKIFFSAQDAMKYGIFDNEGSKNYNSFLKIVFPQEGIDSEANHSFVINSGFYDNRAKVQNLSPEEEWCLDLIIYDKSGNQWSNETILQFLDFKLQEVAYDVASGGHRLGKIWGEIKNKDGRLFVEIIKDIETLTKEQFMKREIKLVIGPKFGSLEQPIYIKKILMYKKILGKDGQIFEPDNLNIEGIVTTVYSFVKTSQVKEAETAEKIKLINIKKEAIDYSVYIPVYNEGAQKTRTITLKESNYYNILQSISETFEAWLDIIALRDPLNPGRVVGKKVAFRRYLGNNNYASFRYGVNLKDIQRTFESKKLVTKLIVKQNSNEFGKNGFCTIARAGGNLTGENNIYDFRYFHNSGMLDPKFYVSQMYYEQNPYTLEEAQGPDTIKGGVESNTQNYFNRLKKLNDNIYSYGENLKNTQLELVDLEAKVAIEEGLKTAAEEGMADTRDRFYSITGLYPDEIGINPFTRIEIKEQTNKWGDLKALNPSWRDFPNPTITSEKYGGQSNAMNWNFYVDLQKDYKAVTLPTEISWNAEVLKEPEKGFLQPIGQAGAVYENDGTISLNCYVDKTPYDGLAISPIGGFENGVQYKMTYTIQVVNGELYTIGSHSMSFNQHNISTDKGAKNSNTDTYEFSTPLTSSSGSIEVEIEGTYSAYNLDDNPYWFIQPNRGRSEGVACRILYLSIKKKDGITKPQEGTYYLKPTFVMYREGDEAATEQSLRVACFIPPYQTKGKGEIALDLVDTQGSSVQKLLNEYVEYQRQFNESVKKLGTEETEGLLKVIKDKRKQKLEQENQIKLLKEWKNQLNEAFYSTYSRFVQEGTWISEDYIDDDKYYNDALSVLYNSSYPQVAYTINVLTLSSLPGYEYFKFQLGDKTYAEDPEFFGLDEKIEVVITEQNNFLDDDSKSTVKVQNFKNQFQDLFQKITATVQQTQYSTGSYEKAVALAEADVQTRGKFVTDALSGMSGKLAVAGQTTVVQDQYGITLTDSITKDEMRLIGGAILMSIQDPDTGERSWKTGLTPDGISASLVTAGTLNAGNVTIMNANEPVFRWDAFGLSAFDVDWSNSAISGKVNPYKFVRFDKYGIYGISNENTFVPEEINSKNQASNQQKELVIDGRSWKPSSAEEILDRATFALTWEGIKIKTNEVETLIGHNQGKIIDIFKTNQDGTKENILTLTENGDLNISGIITTKAGGTIGGWKIGDNYLCTTDSDGNIHNVGTEGSFCIYSSKTSTTGTAGGSPDTINLWRLTIGENFGVSNDGIVYATGAHLYKAACDLISVENSISLQKSNCFWNESGMHINKGAIGCWGITQEWNNNNNIFIEAKATITDGGTRPDGDVIPPNYKGGVAYTALKRDHFYHYVNYTDYGGPGELLYSVYWRDLAYFLNWVKWTHVNGQTYEGIKGIHQQYHPDFYKSPEQLEAEKNQN